MQDPTGGTAHEPQGMTRLDSEADSIVWMKEDGKIFIYFDILDILDMLSLGMEFPRLFY